MSIGSASNEASDDSLLPKYESINELRKTMDTEEIIKSLETLPGWNYDQGYLKKTYDCGDFRAAIAFIVEFSYDCEMLDHHPEIRSVYGKVHIALTTYDVDRQVTQTDIDLARRIEERFQKSFPNAKL